MKTVIKKVQFDSSRELYWARILFLSSTKRKRSQIFASASQEYLEDLNKLAVGSSLNQEHIDIWLKEVVKKWSSLNNQIFKQNVHFDVYSKTTKGEASGLSFLLSKIAVT